MTKFGSDDVAAAAKDPTIAAALAARARRDAAFAAQDVDAVTSVSATDLIVNTPANRVARLETMLGPFKAGRMNYESLDVTLEEVDGRRDHVVIMGEEVVEPKETGPNAGKTAQRRCTDVWRKDADGEWRLTIPMITALE